MVVTSKATVLADPVPPDIVKGRGDRSDPSQAKEVNHQAIEFEVLGPILITKFTKGQHKARTARSSTACSGPKSKYLQACSGPGKPRSEACTGPEAQNAVRPAQGQAQRTEMACAGPRQQWGQSPARACSGPARANSEASQAAGQWQLRYQCEDCGARPTKSPPIQAPRKGCPTFSRGAALRQPRVARSSRHCERKQRRNRWKCWNAKGCGCKLDTLENPPSMDQFPSGFSLGLERIFSVKPHHK